MAVSSSDSFFVPAFEVFGFLVSGAGGWAEGVELCCEKTIRTEAKRKAISRFKSISELKNVNGKMYRNNARLSNWAIR